MITARKIATRAAEVNVLTGGSGPDLLFLHSAGGITAENCPPLVQAGADFLAVVGAVWNHPEGPGAGVRAMNQAIRAANPT